MPSAAVQQMPWSNVTQLVPPVWGVGFTVVPGGAVGVAELGAGVAVLITATVGVSVAMGPTLSDSSLESPLSIPAGS
jgi:hypothetical protein